MEGSTTTAPTRARILAGASPLVLGVALLVACSTDYGAADSTPDASPVDVVAGCTLACGAHGKCTGSGSTASCACTEGYAGADCRACAAGFAADPKSGACESACQVTKCGAHATCQVENGAAVCSCVVGYTNTSKGGSCTWSGGPLDPTFENKPAAEWTLEGGATINPTATGGINPGQALFGSSCNGPRVSQAFAMPAFASAEPLALDVSSYCAGPDCFQRYQLEISGRFHPLINGFSPGPNLTDRYCLGERAFGGNTKVAFTPSCGAYMLGMDNAVIVPAPECPAPGTVPNGSFDGVGGWVATGTGAEIAVGSGTAGSRAGHLAVAKICDSPSLAGRVSVPTSMKSPALAMTVKGTNLKTMNVGLGNTFAVVTGSGVFESASLCLPEWGRGLSLPLTFTLDPGSGTCGAAAPASDFVIDDLTVVSDPTCGDPALVVDGDFERKGSARPWVPFLQGATLSFPSNPGGAHGGTTYAAISGNVTCDYSGISQTMTVPDAVPGAGGPQVRFWYQATVSVGPLSVFGVDALTTTTGWTQHTKCIDPKTAGRAFGFNLSFQSGGMGCAYPSLLLDDVDIVHSKECPE